MAHKNRDGAVDAAPFLELLAGPLTFGSLLRSIRLGEEMSQSEFAAKLGVAASNLSDIENERRNVSVLRASQWAKILGYGETQFVRLALQAELDTAGIKLEVSVAKREKRAKRPAHV